MRTYTLDDIRGLKPCYDPTRYLPEGWTGTPLDVLAVDACPAEDRLWAVEKLLDDRSRRLIACQFVRRTPLADGRTVWDLLTDERSRNAVEVAERFANGEATDEELSAAWVAAWAAAFDAAMAAAWDASRDVVWDAAGDAARAAAFAAAGDAAWAAVWAAARDVARAAAWNAAGDAAWNAQIEIVREFIATNPD